MSIFCKSGAAKKEQMDALIEFRFGSIRNSSFLSNSKIERNEILKGEPSEAVQSGLPEDDFICTIVW